MNSQLWNWLQIISVGQIMHCTSGGQASLGMMQQSSIFTLMYYKICCEVDISWTFQIELGLYIAIHWFSPLTCTEGYFESNTNPSHCRVGVAKPKCNLHFLNSSHVRLKNMDFFQFFLCFGIESKSSSLFSKCYLFIYSL